MARECLSPCLPTRSLVGGSQSHSGKGSRGRSSLGSHKASSPPPAPLGCLKKHSVTWSRLLSPPLPACRLPKSLSLAQSLALGFLSRLEVSKRPSWGVTAGTSNLGSCRPCASSSAGPHPGQRGLGLGPESSRPGTPFPV